MSYITGRLGRARSVHEKAVKYTIRVRGARSSLALFWILLCVLAAGVGPGHASDGGLENKVKSAYILNFTKFIDWGTGEAPDAGLPLKICLLGEASIAEYLHDLTRREVKGRPLLVEQHYSETDALSSCHILFIGNSEQTRLDAILMRLKGLNILTVSDIPQFTRHGGVIGFVTEGGRVQIDINLAAAREAGLKLSAKLLEVARSVQQ